MSGGATPAGRTSRLHGTGSGLCLDVEEAATADGSRIVLWPRDGQSNQKGSPT
ncbi:RICIN domain-containing protein [Streptomyces sp. UH6]|uniref:RICIN domain-containing protein n=1 Tax=Streptomyces sp. UH6 TaxID=2748379 RepID=UPI0015D4D775|nr:RICIN domain-containing protein [Streptomyces sp. UH6]NYV76828.1 RICIN domain-containing protein [Streptomyces sp. UH6]